MVFVIKCVDLKVLKPWCGCVGPFYYVLQLRMVAHQLVDDITSVVPFMETTKADNAQFGME